MEISLQGKVALITGGSRGIGAGIAKAFIQSGARVMISARKREGLEQTAADIGGEIDIFAANAGDPEQARACVSATLDRFGALDILVNNAATNPHYGPFIEVDLPRFDKTIEVNLRGPLIWSQEAWRQIMQQKGGSIINMSSVGGLIPAGPIGVYDMTKAALIFMTQHLASELGPRVRVNAIAPGVVQTQFARVLWEPTGAEGEFPWPLKRVGQPADIASAALYLGSDLASWVTGHTLVVDGGALVAHSLLD